MARALFAGLKPRYANSELLKTTSKRILEANKEFMENFSLQRLCSRFISDLSKFQSLVNSCVNSFAASRNLFTDA